ncbi:hypothetical protein, partial [Anaerotruncus colihominis]
VAIQTAIIRLVFFFFIASTSSFVFYIFLYCAPQPFLKKGDSPLSKQTARLNKTAKKAPFLHRKGANTQKPIIFRLSGTIP